MIIGRVAKGKKIGVWKTYFENGKLKSKGSFDAGEKIGYWEYFHENGQIKQTTEGQQASKVRYDFKVPGSRPFLDIPFFVENSGPII